MRETRKFRITEHTFESEAEEEAFLLAVKERAVDGRVLGTWTTDGYTVWWQEDEAIDPLQVW